MTASETNKDELQRILADQESRTIPLEVLDPARLERLRAKTAKFFDREDS